MLLTVRRPGEFVEAVIEVICYICTGFTPGFFGVAGVEVGFEVEGCEGFVVVEGCGVNVELGGGGGGWKVCGGLGGRASRGGLGGLGLGLIAGGASGRLGGGGSVGEGFGVRSGAARRSHADLVVAGGLRRGFGATSVFPFYYELDVLCSGGH